MRRWVLRGGRVLQSGVFETRDIAVEDGRIAAVETVARGTFECETDLGGALVVPGIVDAHVHFNEPGRAHWEGFETGSAALAAGGGSAFADMPLNAHPPTVDAAAFDAKRRAGEASSRLDFGLWGGIIPGNLRELGPLAALGAVGFKAFMIDSGTEDFPAVSPGALGEAMKVAADTALPVAVHAEDPGIIRGLVDAARDRGAFSWRDYAATRPESAELAACEKALALAEKTGAKVHIVHASCAGVVDLVVSARRRGVRASVEVCPHHVLLEEEAMGRLGVAAKCAPPLRPRAATSELASRLRDGLVDTVGSDHSPAPPEMKRGKFLDAWGGISGCQHGFLLLAERAHSEGGEPALAALWERFASQPAKLLGLDDRKGAIFEGADADIVVLDKRAPDPIRADELKYRHALSAYVAMPLGLRVSASWLRGQAIFPRSRGSTPPRGKFLARRARS